VHSEDSLSGTLTAIEPQGRDVLSVLAALTPPGIERLHQELARAHREECWNEMLGAGRVAIASALTDLENQARADLKLNR
jgi:hypothetical protein